jgi:hypothetical protein
MNTLYSKCHWALITLTLLAGIQGIKKEKKQRDFTQRAQRTQRGKAKSRRNKSEMGITWLEAHMNFLIHVIP